MSFRFTCLFCGYKCGGIGDYIMVLGFHTIMALTFVFIYLLGKKRKKQE